MTRRISPEEARRIPGAEIFLFEKLQGGRVPVLKGQYYAIVANSPPTGIVIAPRHYRGFERADVNYSMGRAGGDGGSVVCFNYRLD
jgi:hypothetical protein